MRKRAFSTNYTSFHVEPLQLSALIVIQESLYFEIYVCVCVFLRIFGMRKSGERLVHKSSIEI